jgi:hypothetical protein
MTTITWAPGSNPEMDKLFDTLREIQFNDHTHRYWKNYDVDSFKYVVALTIYFDENDLPESCSSISNRDCWPKNAYRILNRTWKANNKKPILKQISNCMGEMVLSQIAWLKTNTNYELYFLSRQTNHWEKWAIANFKKQFDIDFNLSNYKYLTCPNECDDTCWQSIVYNGNIQLLEQWKRK